MANTINYYYHKEAWEFAFKDNASEILITNDGSVYKDIINHNNLVVDSLGNLGPMGDYNNTAGVVRLTTSAISNWTAFYDTSIGNIRDGIKTFKLPKMTYGDNLGGVIYYYYKKSAWEYAFLGNVDDIILTADGSVYKGTIDRAGLVVDSLGNTGIAGGAILEPEYTGGDINYYYSRNAWLTAFSGNGNDVLIANDGSVYKGSFLSDNLVVDGLGNIGKAGGNSSYVAPAGVLPSGGAIGDYYRISGRGTISGFELNIDDKITLINDAPDTWEQSLAPFFYNGGDINYYYNKEAWYHAFNNKNAEIIITKDDPFNGLVGGVYVNSIAVENLVVDNTGVVGIAGIDIYGSKIFNEGAIANQIERLFYYVEQTKKSANLNDATGTELLDWATILELPQYVGESDELYKKRIGIYTTDKKHTPAYIKAGLEKFVPNVNILEFGKTSAYCNVSYCGYFTDRTLPVIVKSAVVGAKDVATLTIELSRNEVLEDLTYRQIVVEVARQLVLVGVKYELIIV